MTTFFLTVLFFLLLGVAYAWGFERGKDGKKQFPWNM